MRRAMVMVILFSISILVSLAAAGCGGDESSQTTSPGPSTPSVSGLVETIAEFVDVAASHPYAKQIAELVKRKIAEGFSDGTFRPENAVTRQQFAKMIVKAMGYPVSEEDVCPFTDVPKGSDLLDPLYPDNYIAVAAARGITEGVTPTEFAPNDSISRAQLITMIVRAANLPEPPEDYTPPFPKFDDVHYPFARKAAHAGLLTGLQGMGPDYEFFKPATRGEVAVLLYNLLHM
ncbi:MAG: S-layer homology domain-containing protein [Actinobacteria bacterium]|nr:S-layer homology domain-containing protein [Actinomycetota bacterium]